MARKNDILEAWIMVEHLSEGDINIKDKFILTLDGLQGQDFYFFFQKKIKEKKFTSKEDGGIVVYFDIFDFQEVASILRKKYNLKPTDEEIRTGKKFSLALYFDKHLNFQSDMTFFTASAYIRYYHEVLKEKEFQDFEEKIKKQLEDVFEGTSKDKKKFNTAVQKILLQKEILPYEIKVENCYMQILKDIKTEATKLHSFFINDLEKVKKEKHIIDNLNAYLFGNEVGRINLDSHKKSEKFNPNAFEQILQPKNYPVGRFPSNTEYALSLMQQVAVNLSIGFDNNQIRSVNGPPGTGKTTLLRDIFAQLVVEQAYDIAKLSDHAIKGTEETIYSDNESIGVIPPCITENNIVVASSNNGAVQNIVNELPLSTEIDEILIEDLKQVDYFREISNAKVSEKRKEDESGNCQEELVSESCQGEDKFWGLFSLEGGKADNMTNIRRNIERIHKYLEEYKPDQNQNVYKDFLIQYDKVAVIRTKMQRFADNIQVCQDYIQTHQACAQDLKQVRISYPKELEQKKKQLDAELQEFEDTKQKYEQQLKELNSRMETVKHQKETVKKDRYSMELCLQTRREQKPCFFARKKKKEEYNSRLSEITDQLIKLKDEDTECDRQEKAINKDIIECQEGLNRSTEERMKLKKTFVSWKNAEEEKISKLEKKARDLEEKICEYERIIDSSKIKPLDMNLEYDKLQMSNPWFDESYRIAQAKLFIAALRVRKQFLYENKKNIEAAVSIWREQQKYLDRKHVIEAAWNWINMTIPVISSTFASFSRMCRNLGVESLGHLFIDEAGQALPQAAVGAIYRSRHVMVVGDPSQIKPVLTLDSNTLNMLSSHFEVTEKYLSASASVQTLADAASQYGFYRKPDRADSWIGIPLWVHRRCLYPMFTISNEISYDGFMVQGMKGNGKTGWFDIGGKTDNKYVKEQGEFLLQKIRKMMDQNPKITDKKEKDEIYVITPFANVAKELSKKLNDIGFTRYSDGKPTNVGTVHTFQGKEAPIVFLVLGADWQSSGAACWAVSEPNIMNVAATRAKKEFYIIGAKDLYLGLERDVVKKTVETIEEYKEKFPELVDDDVSLAESYEQAVETLTTKTDLKRVTGTIKCVGRGTKSFYAYVTGDDGKEYSITEDIYDETNNAKEMIQKGKQISFVPKEGKNKPSATNVKLVDIQSET